MLVGQKHSIRNTIKDGGEIAKEEISKLLKLSILFLANTYTGANFSNPPTQEQRYTIETCTSFVIDMFPMIGIKEIELSFKMAAANKFEGLNLETYYGKFTVQFLGKVLAAYLKHRNRVLGEHSKAEEIENRKEKKEVVEEKNVLAKCQIVKEYNELKESYEKGELLEVEPELKASWAKVLIEKGIINFTPEKKKEIHSEAKILVNKEIRQELMNTKTKPVRINQIKHILKRMKDKGYCDDYVASLTARYSKLLILKSIVNG